MLTEGKLIMVDYAHSFGQSNSPCYAEQSRHKSVDHSFYRRTGKRVLDCVFTLAFIPLIGVVVLFLWLIIRRDGGPGFFGHTRVGQDGRKFRCWKLRTMSANAEDALQDYLASNPEAARDWERDRKLKHDPRVTKFGAFLRKTSLDELPQFWNVLMGDMSIVGPRPIVTAELEKYGSDKSGYLSMKPGVTGLWQVSGRNSVSYAERVGMDMVYQSRMSFGLDAVIVIRTVFTVIYRTGQ